MPTSIVEAATQLISTLKARGISLSVAESCTGGLLGGALTDVSGSSAVFERGFITYSNAAKTDLLGVSPETLATHGAVSAETAIEMAEGALARARADLAVSITGVAGPGGGTTEKPVGLVWFARAEHGRATVALHRAFGPLGRAAIRTDSVAVAIALLLAGRD